MSAQPLVEIGVHQRAVGDDRTAVHDRVPRRCRPAAQPRLDRVADRPGEARSVERPHRQIADGAGGEHTELAGPAEARRPAQRRHLQRGARGRRAGTVAQLRQQHRLARLEPQRPCVGRRRAVDTEADGDTSGAQVDHRGDAGGEDQVARRAVGDADAGRAEPQHLAGVGRDAMGEPHAVGQPTGAGEVVRRATPERRQREGVVLGVLGEVGVQPHVEALGQLRRAGHQLLGDTERRARRQRHARHRPVGAVVVAVDGVLAGGEDVVVVGHDVVGRQPAVLLRQRHRATRRVEAHAEVGGGVDLGGEQVAGTVGVHVQVVARRRAPRQRQLRQPDPRRQVRRLGVERRPQRVQRPQPAEQRLVGHRRVGPRQVLEEMVMGVHEAGRDEAPTGVDRPRRHGCHAGADRGDEPVGDGDPAVGELAPLGVHRRHAPRAGDDEISCHVNRGADRRPGWRRWRRGRRPSSAG